MEHETDEKTPNRWIRLLWSTIDENKLLEYSNAGLGETPKCAELWGWKGYALHELGRDEEAIECYDIALEIDPNDVKTLYYKNYSLYKLRRHEEAIKCYDIAIKRDPDNFDILNDKAEYLTKIGNYKEARKCHDIALKIESEYSKGWKKIGKKE